MSSENTKIEKKRLLFGGDVAKEKDGSEIAISARTLDEILQQGLRPKSLEEMLMLMRYIVKYASGEQLDSLPDSVQSAINLGEKIAAVEEYELRKERKKKGSGRPISPHELTQTDRHTISILEDIPEADLSPVMKLARELRDEQKRRTSKNAQ